MNILKKTLSITSTGLLVLLVSCVDKDIVGEISTDVEYDKAIVAKTEKNSNSDNELQARKSMYKKIQTLFEKEDFTELDKLALLYQDSNQRTNSGLWKLTLFHAGFGFDIKNKEPAYWKNNFEKVDRWIEHNNSSPVAHIVKANLYRQYAWSFRGSSYAKNVPREAWKPFKNNLRIADDYLEKNKKIASVSPQWYVEKVEVLTGLGEDTTVLDKIVDEGIEKFPNYYQLYFQAIRYLAPKWHGDAKQIEAFANKAVSVTHKTEGMGMYARIYWFASQTQYDESLFYGSNVVWDKMKEGIFDVTDKYPDQWNIQNFAYFSCLAKDKTMTRNLMKQVKKPILMEAWKSQKMYNYCKAF